MAGFHLMQVGALAARMPGLARRLGGALALLLAVLASPVQALAEPVIVRSENTAAELVSSLEAVPAGQSLDVALRLKSDPTWHTYWRNSGDSGLATEIAFTLPPGFVAGPIQWPLPDAIATGPLVNYGFGEEILLVVSIQVPANARPGPLNLAAKADWLECSDICIPGTAQLSVPVEILPAGVAPRPHPVWFEPVARAIEQSPSDLGLRAQVTTKQDKAILLVQAGASTLDLQTVKGAYFFPDDGALFNHAAAQPFARLNPGLALELTPVAGAELAKTPLRGVLALLTPQGRIGVEISAEPMLEGAAAISFGPPTPLAASRHAKIGPPEGDASAPLTLGGLGLAVLFAFLGGLILNVMPCVFPVLSMKALGLASLAQEQPARVRADGLVFFYGVLVAFLALAGILLVLRAAGEQVGWAFQLQDPWIVGGLALLFFVLGLNLLGMFEIGSSVQGVGQSLKAKGGLTGTFFTGLLAVVAAAPCTAPFMGTAMGVAFANPPPVTLAVFTGLAVGFAAPYLLIAFVPGLLRVIPRPGPWMEHFRHGLSFAMFAAAVWLAWVMAAHGQEALLALLSSALALAFLIWVFGRFAGWRMRAFALVGVFASFLILFGPSVRAAFAPKGASEVTAQAWSPEAVAAAQASGKVVFVNFTADWCISCKANERVALSTARVQEAMAAGQVVYLKGDWTRRDAAIAAELARFKRAGVPLYLVYPATGAQPVILPELLTEDIVLSALKGAASPAP